MFKHVVNLQFSPMGKRNLAMTSILFDLVGNFLER